MSVRRHLTGTLAVPLLVVALTACGGGDDSVADPPISSPPTSSPTQAPHRESAEHFIRRFYGAEQRMENTGKTGPYRHLTRGCVSCASLAHQVATYYDDGGYVRWAGIQIQSIRPYGSSAKGRIFAVKGVAEPTTYRSSSNASTSHLSGGPTTELVTLAKHDGSWRVAGFAKLAGH
jgi:hypothetical protein